MNGLIASLSDGVQFQKKHKDVCFRALRSNYHVLTPHLLSVEKSTRNLRYEFETKLIDISGCRRDALILRPLL